jgi:hypothetical protein
LLHDDVNLKRKSTFSMPEQGGQTTCQMSSEGIVKISCAYVDQEASKIFRYLWKCERFSSTNKRTRQDWILLPEALQRNLQRGSGETKVDFDTKNCIQNVQTRTDHCASSKNKSICDIGLARWPRIL